jgi:hypothetical protein
VSYALPFELPIAGLFSRDPTTPRARVRWAKSIAKLADELRKPPSPIRGVRRLYRPEVAAACTPELIEIESVLRDPTARVRPEAMRRLRDFLTDAGSPLYRDAPDAAHRTAREIAAAFVVPAHAHVAPWAAAEHDSAARR